MSKAGKILGDASDIPAFLPDKIAGTRIFASLEDFVAAVGHRDLFGFDGPRDADGLRLTALGEHDRQGLLMVPRSATPDQVQSMFAEAPGRPSLDLCFLDYLTWLPAAEKNPLVAVIAKAINETDGAYLKAYIMSAEGCPRIVVGFTRRA